jgi:hypothetical protein
VFPRLFARPSLDSVAAWSNILFLCAQAYAVQTRARLGLSSKRCVDQFFAQAYSLRDCGYFVRLVRLALAFVSSRGRSVVFLVSHRIFRGGCTLFFLTLPVKKDMIEVSEATKWS